MTRPTARVLALLEILQAGGTRTVADLARRLGVDERTVRRYAAHLVELDIPVRSVRGRYGGLRLAPGYRMPPLMLTGEEAVAVVIGLLTSRHAGLLTVSATAAESALAKLRRALPAELGRRVGALVGVTAFATPPHPATDTAADVLLGLADAVAARRPVRFGYRDRGGVDGARTVRPYGLVAHAGRWYLTGTDAEEQADDDRADTPAVRRFRVDRMSDPVALPGAVDVPAGLDPGQQVLTGIAEAPWRYAVSVRMPGTPPEVGARFAPGLATVEPLDGPGDPPGWVRVRLRAERLDWVPGVLVAADLPFVLEGPDELRGPLRALAARLLDAAGDDPGAAAVLVDVRPEVTHRLDHVMSSTSGPTSDVASA